MSISGLLLMSLRKLGVFMYREALMCCVHFSLCTVQYLYLVVQHSAFAGDDCVGHLVGFCDVVSQEVRDMRCWVSHCLEWRHPTYILASYCFSCVAA
jgi:hypothetical protein